MGLLTEQFMDFPRTRHAGGTKKAALPLREDGGKVRKNADLLT